MWIFLLRPLSDRRRVEPKLFGYNFKSTLLIYFSIFFVSLQPHFFVVTCSTKNQSYVAFSHLATTLWTLPCSHQFRLKKCFVKYFLQSWLINHNQTECKLSNFPCRFMQRDIEGQAPSHLWFLAFPTLGKSFKLLYLCMHHNNPLITKMNLRFLKCKHCMVEHPMKNHKQSLVTLLLINDYIGRKLCRPIKLYCKRISQQNK